MKATSDIKKEYKNFHISEIVKSYWEFKKIKKEGLYRNMSPDTKKEVINEAGRFSWYSNMNKKLEEAFSEFESHHSSKKVQKEIDLLGLDEISENSIQKIEPNEQMHRARFDEHTRLREIISKEILNYPLSKTLYEIRASVNSIKQSDSREEKAKNADFSSTLAGLKSSVKDLTKYSAYSVKCDEVLSMHELLFKHSTIKEEKEFHIREILKLEDQLTVHRFILNYETNNKSFTSQFLDSDYSLTQEEANWWMKDRAPRFEKQKTYESLGVNDFQLFDYWLTLEDNKSLHKTKSNEIYKEIDKIVLQEARSNQSPNTAINFDNVAKEVEKRCDLAAKKYEVEQYNKHLVEKEANRLIKLNKLKEHVELALGSKEEMEELFNWREAKSYATTGYEDQETIDSSIKLFKIDKFFKTLPEFEEFNSWAKEASLVKKGYFHYMEGYFDESTLHIFSIFQKEKITNSILNEILNNVFDQVNIAENPIGESEGMQLTGDSDV